MSGTSPTVLVLHLGGPLQSWGGTSRFNQRDTNRYPTRSGLIGLIASSKGLHRDIPPKDLRSLRFITRIDRPGTVTMDFHTVGGGLSSKNTVATAAGKRRPGDTGTLVSHRYYLADAAFTVAVTADDPAMIRQCQEHLEHPQWPLFLGRRSCPPAGPLLIGTHTDALEALSAVPLARSAPKDGSDIDVDFVADHPATTDAETLTTIEDDPVSFARLDRRYRSRPVYGWTQRFSSSQCGGLGLEYLDAIEPFQKGATT